MIILDVVGASPLNGNTTVIVKGDDSVLKNGIGILDTNGRPHKIISVGLTSSNAEKTTIPLLIEGEFSSDKIFV